MTFSGRIFAAGILGLSLLAIPFLSQRLDQLRPQATLREVMYIQSARSVRYLSLGYTGLAASIYWTRAVQYFGEKHVVKAERYDLLAPLLNLATELDPKLTVAYEFGSVFLSQPPPQGAGDPDKAIALVEKGIQKNPNRWRLYYYLGFIHYSERQDYPAAADAFERGSRVPGAHPWLRVMAAATRQKGGDIETARFLWTKIYESTEDKMVKETALMRLAALRVDSDIAYIEGLIQRYRAQSGANPHSWQQLIAAGYIGGVPADPTGAAYRLIPDGRVEVQDPDKLPFIQKGLPPGRQGLQYNPKAAIKP
jgi:tetratricopeptide (TPR) repeat protein